MTDEQILKLAKTRGIEDDGRTLFGYGDVIAFARALLAASIADTAGAKPIYQLKVEGIFSRWEDVSKDTYDLCMENGDPSRARIVLATPPAPSVADAAGASERRFEIRQGGMTVAATEGPGADAYRDAVHYFWQYQQDATEDEPVEMVELTTVMRIDAIAKESGND